MSLNKPVAPHLDVEASQRTLDAYPSSDDLRRVVRAWAPEIVFLNIENTAIGSNHNRQLEAEFPAIPRVALNPSAKRSSFAGCFSCT